MNSFVPGSSNPAKLKTDLDDYAKAHSLTSDAVEREVDNFKSQLGEGAGQAMRQNLKALATSAVNEPGMSLSGFGSSADIVVSKNYTNLFMRPNDLPSGKSPLSPEQIGYLIFLHEAAHAKDAVAVETVAPTKLSAEIRGDLNVVRALNDSGDQHLKDYYLGARNVSTFANQVRQLDDPHDTATFIRELDRTGREIDMNAFAHEKDGLVEKIRDRLVGIDPVTKKGTGYDPKTADIMAATQNVLMNEKLTPVQMAIAEDYLGDARNIGYVANPDFKPALPLAMFMTPAAAPTSVNNNRLGSPN